MSDGGDERLETRVMERLLARLSPGSQEETLPTTDTEGEPGAVCGSWVPGSMGDRGPWISVLAAAGDSPAGASNR